MKRILALCLAAVPGLLATACGISEVQADAAAAPSERVYTTGSNIGHHRNADGVGSDVTTVGSEAAEQQLKTRGALPPRGPGGG